MDNSWFKISPSKLLSIMSSLPTGQMRAHMMLLVTIYLIDGGLPDDDEAMAFRSSLPLDDIQALRPYFRFLGRCEDGRLYFTFAEEIIMERVEFAEKKAHAARKRWADSASTAEQTSDKASTAKHGKKRKSTAKQRIAQQGNAEQCNAELSHTYIHTDMHTCMYSGEEEASSPGADALADSPSLETCPGSREGEENADSREGGKKPDPLFVIFCEMYSQSVGHPYGHTTADFVQLARMRKRFANAKPSPWEVTLERFRVAAKNFFGSELGNHTLADLCARFSAFHQHRLDRFGHAMPAPVGSTDSVTVSGAGDEWANREIAATVEDLPAPFRRVALDASTEEQKANVLAGYNRRVLKARGMEAQA